MDKKVEKNSKLKKIENLIDFLDKLLNNCVLCPHSCKVERKNSEEGFCSAGYLPEVSSAIAHHGEEPPISGSNGSGTIFFSHCNMRCVYCQNYQISQEFEGQIISMEKLSELMLELQNKNCHNINFVSPTIWIPQIIKAASMAIKNGLKIPFVYNTGGYDNPAIIKMLDGIIDIYMPDIRYSQNSEAEKYSSAKDYVKFNRKSIIEMYRQVGDLKFDRKKINEDKKKYDKDKKEANKNINDRNEVAVKGLLIRLLVLPNNIGGIKETLEFIKNELSDNVYLSIMAQYHPEYKAYSCPELSRRIPSKEYYDVVNYAEKLGFTNGWIQNYISLSEEEDLFIPDFKKKEVFKYYK